MANLALDDTLPYLTLLSLVYGSFVLEIRFRLDIP